MSKNDGGPAFPVQWMDRDSTGEQVVREQWGGMSLRKWYAGIALAALISLESDADAKGIAHDAFFYADAMLDEGEEE